MDFELDPAAVALLEAVVPVLDTEATPALIRAAWATDAADADADAGAGARSGAAGGLEQVRKVWATLTDVGLAGALVPERDDGLGLTLSDVVPLFERLGEVGLPVPAVETIAFAAPLLAAAGHPALPDVLAGRALVAVATRTPDAEILVPHGQHADLVIIPVPASTDAEQDGFGALPFGGARLRTHTVHDLELVPVGTVDGARAMSRLTTFPATGVMLTDDPDDAQLAWWRAAVGTSAVLVGLATRLLAITVDYVKTRHQFGVPVGSFQAVKHACASAHLATEFARPAVHAAGWQLAHSPADDLASARDAASVAKVLAAEAARLAARVAIQCHGAIAYTTEYDLHLYAKRAWALIAAFGDPHFHRARLADSLGLGVTANGDQAT